MSTWKELIVPNTAVWSGVELYIEERIADLAQVCTSEESTDSRIRQAQAGIVELRRIANLPQLIRAETQIRGAKGQRKEY
jgi:hypothetical protein